MQLSTAYEWLAYINQIHPKKMDLGLDRVRKVALNGGLLEKTCPIVIVGGTNGKGTTVTALESIYLAASYRTGTFTSPYLFRYNEEIRINGEPVSDAALVEAFQAIENMRGTITLTYFEFGTLAALYLFKKQPLDIVILEIGLGGRLDSVNIVEPDISIITSIGLDHMDWLGQTREAIGFEKAAILRKGVPFVCGDKNPPQTVLDKVKECQSPFYCLGNHFSCDDQETNWTFISKQNQIFYPLLPLSSLQKENLSCAIMAATLLQSKLPINKTNIIAGLNNLYVPARIESFQSDVTTIFDVSHNEDSVKALKKYLQKETIDGKTFAVFSMLKDKDIDTSIKIIKDEIDAWFVAPIQDSRGMTLEDLSNVFSRNQIEGVRLENTLSDVYHHAIKKLSKGDRLIIFGSFYTIAELEDYYGKPIYLT